MAAWESELDESHATSSPTVAAGPAPAVVVSGNPVALVTLVRATLATAVPLILPTLGVLVRGGDDLTAQQELTPRPKEFVNYGLARYGTLLLLAPFDAGKTLLQVHYLPNDDDLELAMAEERVREVEQRKIQDEELWHARQEDERRHQDQLWRS
ncbi:hypothetical protein BGX31_003855, partial [Mortierella sp. GBA43]